jgi:hypothetical protein
VGTPIYVLCAPLFWRFFSAAYRRCFDVILCAPLFWRFLSAAYRRCFDVLLCAPLFRRFLSAAYLFCPRQGYLGVRCDRLGAISDHPSSQTGQYHH